LLAAFALGWWRLVALKLPAERPVAPVAKLEIVKLGLVNLGLVNWKSVNLKSVKMMTQQAMLGIELAAARTSQASGIGQRPGPGPVTWIFRAEFS
jgi:hypothetical protein